MWPSSAIAASCVGYCGAACFFRQAYPAPAAAEPTGTSASAERRHLTVMFCDLVGSTAISARLDPEDMRSVINAYHRCCSEFVERNGGFVAKYMGDGVLAYFGYPQAHEDDAEHAVRAGLALADAAPKLNTVAGSALQVRVGIATGLVVVGDLIGAGSAQEQAVVGETPNLAARLQAVAAPGAVVLAESTRRLTGGLFEYRDLGAVSLKGFSQEVAAWQALGEGAAEGRFEALRRMTTPLVGRDEEIELLLRRWDQAKREEGCVVLVSGEPGIGKSRLGQTLLERLSGEPHTRLRYFCSPYHQNSALYPSIAQLERAAGFRREDAAEQKLAKLEALLSLGTNDLGDVIPLFADLLAIPTGERYPPLMLTPQKKKERTLHAQVAQVEGLAAREPVLMVFEDVHWSDPTTREGLDLLIERIPALRALVDPDVPTRIQSALDRTPTREPCQPESVAAAPASRDDRLCRLRCFAEGNRRSNCRTDRRRAALHRGVDEDGYRKRSGCADWRRLCGDRAGRAAGDTSDTARLSAGAARSPGPDARDSANRLGSGTPVLPRTHQRGRPSAAAASGRRARAARRRRINVPARCPA